MMSTTARRRKHRPPLELELRLEEWGARGAATAHADGRRIVVDRGLPGELVLASVDRRQKPWRGVVEAVRESAPERVEAPCPYYHRGCGGCQWQHVSYESQVAFKRALVDREMEYVGLSMRVAMAHAMDDPWRYRRTAAIALGWEAGFRPRGRRGIVEIHDCAISHPAIGTLAHHLNLLLRSDRLPRYHGKVWLDCTVVGSDRHPGVQVVIQGIEGLTLESHPELPEVASAVGRLPGVVSVSFRHRSGEVHPLVGDLLNAIELAGQDFWVPAGAFFQANVVMLERLLVRLASVLSRRTVDLAADVYGGVGVFGLALAPQVGRMILIELDSSAVQAARRTASDRGLNNVSFVSGHAERALPELAVLDLAIVDPPRSGLGPVTVDALAAGNVQTIAYVSCSPTSLARDLAALSQHGYTAETLELFDFYPHTYHSECLTILNRAG
ncbi:MAG TPA: 23S rRNA (uracil(1939)-C(5))-methyltransferase RlmD [Chloroflexota bacterium]